MGNSYNSLNAPWTASGQKTRLSLLQRMNAEQVDEQTWQDFFRKYSPFILMMGNSRAYQLTRDEIKELWSKVFLEIHKKGIGAYDREKGSFRSWFKAFVINLGRGLVVFFRDPDFFGRNLFDGFAFSQNIQNPVFDECLEPAAERALFAVVCTDPLFMDFKKDLAPQLFDLVAGQLVGS